MARTFLTGNDVRFTAHDLIFLDAELFTGEKLLNLEPRRLFPVSGTGGYISFLDDKGEERFILTKIDELEESQRTMLNSCLEEYYRIPKITEIRKINKNSSLWVWDVVTDRGRLVFEMIDVIHAIKLYYDKRVLLRDSKDNRYEIPDYTTLNRSSIKLITSVL